MAEPEATETNTRFQRAVILGYFGMAALAVVLVMTMAVLAVINALQATADQPPPGNAPPGNSAGQKPAGQGPQAPVMGASLPERVVIPKLKVSAPVGQLGVDKKGEIENPPLSRPNLTGWYRHGPMPGQLGPAVVLGHVDTYTGPAVFKRLKSLVKGDRVEIVRKDRSVAVFEVDSLEQVAKKAFPTSRVYGDLNHAGLRLVTCGGTYDRRARSYTDNVIVYAHLVSTRNG